MKTGFYTNPIFLEHDTGSHPENANRLRAITDKLESEGILEKLKLQSGRPATVKELKMVHSEKLIYDETISEGMIPKIRTCIDAVNNGVRGVAIIDGRKPHSILFELFS